MPRFEREDESGECRQGASEGRDEERDRETGGTDAFVVVIGWRVGVHGGGEESREEDAAEDDGWETEHVVGSDPGETKKICDESRYECPEHAVGSASEDDSEEAEVDRGPGGVEDEHR